MRIYLTSSKEIVDESGGRHVARGGAFYDFPTEQAEAWIALGDAKPATEDNRVVEPEPAASQTEG